MPSWRFLIRLWGRLIRNFYLIEPLVASPGASPSRAWPLSPPPLFLGTSPGPPPSLGLGLGPLLHFTCDGLARPSPRWALASVPSSIFPGGASLGLPPVGPWPRSSPPFFLGWPRWSFPRLGHDLGPLLHFSCEGLAWSSPPWAVASVPSSIFSWGGLAEHTLVWGLAWVPSSIFSPGVASPGTLLPGVWPGSPPPFFLGTSKIKHPVLQSHASSSVFPWGPLSGIPFGRCWFLRLRLGWHFSGQPNVWTCVRFRRLRAKGADMGSPFCQKRPLRLQICTVKAMKDRPPRSQGSGGI